MSRLVWDALGERLFEIGLDRGVLYTLSNELEFTNGVPWNGLTGVNDSSGGHEVTPLFTLSAKADAAYGIEEYAGTIKAYTYPDEFEKMFGEAQIANGLYLRQQERPLFGFTYRTLIGNDTESSDFAYKLHLVYNARVSDFNRSFSSLKESLDVGEIEIPFETFGIDTDDYEPVSEIIFDSRSMSKERLSMIEEILYGSDKTSTPPRLPYPDEIITLFEYEDLIQTDWYGYPNNLLYPAGDLYPGTAEAGEIDTDSIIRRTGSVSVTFTQSGLMSFSPNSFIGIPPGYSIAGVVSYTTTASDIVATLLTSGTEETALQFVNTSPYQVACTITVTFLLIR